MRYSVLGTTEVWDGDRAVPLGGGGRIRAVLTALAVHADEPVPAQTLIAEVWADTPAPPTDTTGALQALIARLRRTLGREAITSGPGGYRLNTPRESVDLHRFEAMVRTGEAELRRGTPEEAARTLGGALELWRGPALADLPDRGAAAARPEALRLTARRLRIEADLKRGRTGEALPALREAVADHPLDEAFRAQLIRALRAEGRTADALVAYDDARTVLAEALGADPGPELRALHAELLTPRPMPPQPMQKQPITEPPRQRQGNLRARLTSFVGRENDLDAIRRDLATVRLVTLTGPGGSGKTRLAQEAAEAMDGARPDPYPDGVWLAELAPLDDPAAIPHAVLSALGRRDTTVLTAPGGREPRKPEALYAEEPMARLLEHCARRRLLLVLDNCEHLIGAAAHLAAELLAECPGLTILATSREPLGVPGEVVRPVEPLPPPTARRLFADRAATVRPSVPQTVRPTAEPFSALRMAPNAQPSPPPISHESEDETAAIDEICRRLDGLPLGIELAAARLRALSPRQIADRLDDRFRLLTSGSRTVLPRQQTLRAVVDWSWDLLDEPERTALCALSVFAGGCTLGAAEAVCGPDALQTVAQLVDKSLVVAVHGLPGGIRYRLLETIHEYAAERAAERPAELAAACARHAAYYRDLVAATDPELRGADQLRGLELLETELDNIRAALHRTLAARHEPDVNAMVLAMGWFWWLRNYRDEAAGWLERAIALGGEPPDDEDDPVYWARHDLRMLYFFVISDSSSEEQWSSEESRAAAMQLAAAYGKGGPAAARFPGLLWPFTRYVLGDGPGMRAYADQVVDDCRRYGGDWEVAAALMLRTHINVDSPGGMAAVDADWAELRGFRERIVDRWMLAQLHSAGAEIAIARGRYDVARAEYDAAHRLGLELGAYGEGAVLLARMADVAYRSGDYGGADELLDKAAADAEQYGVWDARTYIRYLRAMLFLLRGEVAEARRMAELTVGHVADGTPPPMFAVQLLGLRARITAAEGDPRGALVALAEAGRTSLAASCTEPVMAAQLDAAAEVLAGLASPDDLRSAFTLAVAADGIRGMLPRTEPERVADAAVRRRVAAALTPDELAAARAAGEGLDPQRAMGLIGELAGVPVAGE